MATRQAPAQQVNEVRRRALLQAGLATGVTLSVWPLWSSPALWGAEVGQPRRGGILRARGRDPVHFDPHLTRNQGTHAVLSFVYSKLLQHKVGADVPPGSFIVEPDLVAEALAVVNNSGERHWEAELYRLKGELLPEQAGTRHRAHVSRQPW